VEVLADVYNHNERNKTLSRLLIGLSISDIIFSTPWFFSTWPIPPIDPHPWGATGTVATCELQGTMFQLGWMAGPLYNLCLAVYYLLIIKYGYHENHFRTMEPYIHCTIIILAVVSAMVPIPLDLYNASHVACWIDSFPASCQGDE
jgi:hypothetical protein